MFFRQILHEEKSCLSYLVGCATRGVCAAVDPQGNAELYFDILAKNSLQLTAVIETHIQADHVSIAPELADRSGATLYYGPGADVRFGHHELTDGEVINIGNRDMRVLHTPGHTLEHICLYVDEWFVLTGDTLFVGDVGRVDLSLEKLGHPLLEARSNFLYHSLGKLQALPLWTEVYPGHYSGSVCGKGMDGKSISTIGRELRKNKALQLSQEQFTEYLTQNVPPLPEGFKENKRKNMGL